MKLQICATAIALMTAQGASAATPADDPFKDLDCRKATVQIELNVCADREFQSWDGRLNAIYSKLLKDADPKDQALLRSAERSWLSFRDNECTYETSDSEGGSIHPMDYANCMTAKTRARITELKSPGN